MREVPVVLAICSAILVALWSCASSDATVPHLEEAGIDAMADTDAGELDAGTIDAPIDGESADTAMPDGSFTTEGDIRCCYPGQGTACCVGAKPTTRCFEYGGDGTCRSDGDYVDGHLPCMTCCEGLIRSDVIAPGNVTPPEQDGLPDGCDRLTTAGQKQCLRCGDGVCGTAENWCNCPTDCPPDGGI